MSTTYRITEKGRAEIAATGGTVSTTVKKLLESVGAGATFSDIRTTVPQVPEVQLREVVNKLVAEGYLEAVRGDLTV